MAVTFVTGNKNKLEEVQAILADVLPNLRSQALDCKYLIIMNDFYNDIDNFIMMVLKSK